MNFYPSRCQDKRTGDKQVTNPFPGRVQVNNQRLAISQAQHELMQLTLVFPSSPRDRGSLCFHGMSTLTT